MMENTGITGLSLYDKQNIVAMRGLAANAELPNSIRRNLSPYGSYVTPKMQEDMQRARDLTKICLQERLQFERSEVPDFFAAVVESENENMDRFNSYIWTPKEIKQISDAGLVPHQTNIQHPFEMKLLGEMQATETRFQAVGIGGPETKKKAEVINNGLLWVSQVNRLNRTNNYVFRDGSIGKRGVCSVMRDPFDPLGMIKMKRCRPQEFMWDPVAAEDGSLRGSKYLWRGYYVDSEDLLPQYPLFRKEIDSFDFTAHSRRFLFDFTLATPKIRSKAKRNRAPYTYQNLPFRNPRKRIWITEFFRRNKTPAFAVFDAVKGIDHIFKVEGDTSNFANWSAAEKHAGYFYGMLREAYQYGIAASGGNPNKDVVAQPRLDYVDTVDMMIFGGDFLIDIQNFDGEMFPYHHFIPEFVNGEMMGYFEHTKDDVYLASRMRIYLDLLMSGVKGHTWYDQEAIESAGITPKQFEDNLTRPTKTTGVQLKNGKKISEVIHQSNPPNYGPLPQVILDYATRSVDRSNGGLAGIGSADYAGQSGSAIRKLQTSGAVGTIPLFKEWEFYLTDLGEATKNELQHISPLRLLATIDERNQVQYSRFLDSFQPDQFKIRIEEISASPSDREVQANLLFTLLHNSPDMLAMAFDEFADLSGVERSRIDRINAKLLEKQEFERMLEMRKQKMEEDGAKADQIRRDQEEMRKWRETEIMANPPVKTTASIKIDGGPGLASEIVNQAGIPADVKGMAGDMATGALMRGAERVMTQQNWNKNLTPEEKTALKGGNKAFVSKAPPRAKDMVNREK